MGTLVGYVGEGERSLADTLGFSPDSLSSLLSSLQEAVEITDNRGNVIYINQAFTRFTGLSFEEWVGKNLFEAAPQTPLVAVLASRQPVYNQRAVVLGLEAVVNAVPVMANGQLVGGVMCWQPLTQVGRLQEELKQSHTLIANLYARMQQMAGAKYAFDHIIGSSKATKAAVNAARKAAKTDSPVLILGETGTGKELYAHAIHQASNRRDKPFIKYSCTAIPESSMEDELFGQGTGVYPAGDRAYIGRLELANGGTLFIDEVANLSLFLQDKLLRVLQHWEFFRVGGTQPIKVDVRIIASSNRDLKGLVAEGKFREELLSRLQVREVILPALRQRREDIPLFVDYLKDRLNRKLNKHIKAITPQALQVLLSYSWPGNVRELENVLERAMLVADEPQLTPKHLAECLPGIRVGMVQDFDIMPLNKMEEILLRAALARYGDNLEGKKKAARALNISLATLYNKLKKYDI